MKDITAAKAETIYKLKSHSNLLVPSRGEFTQKTLHLHSVLQQPLVTKTITLANADLCDIRKEQTSGSSISDQEALNTVLRIISSLMMKPEYLITAPAQHEKQIIRSL